MAFNRNFGNGWHWESSTGGAVGYPSDMIPYGFTLEPGREWRNEDSGYWIFRGIHLEVPIGVYTVSIRTISDYPFSIANVDAGFFNSKLSGSNADNGRQMPHVSLDIPVVASGCLAITIYQYGENDTYKKPVHGYLYGMKATVQYGV